MQRHLNIIFCLNGQTFCTKRQPHIRQSYNVIECRKHTTINKYYNYVQDSRNYSMKIHENWHYVLCKIRLHHLKLKLAALNMKTVLKTQSIQQNMFHIECVNYFLWEHFSDSSLSRVTKIRRHYLSNKNNQKKKKEKFVTLIIWVKCWECVVPLSILQHNFF